MALKTLTSIQEDEQAKENSMFAKPLHVRSLCFVNQCLLQN